MDELLDVLIESGGEEEAASGSSLCFSMSLFCCSVSVSCCDPRSSPLSLQEMPANAREERDRSVTKVVPPITVSPGCPGIFIPWFHRHYEHLPYDHSAANHVAESHLDALLGAGPAGRGAELALLKAPAEALGQEEEAREGEAYSGPQQHQHHHPRRHPHPHPPQDKAAPGRDAMDTPLSPGGSKLPAGPEVQGMVSMTFSETPWESMEWLDLTPPSSATAFSVAPPTAPSIFNTEFLDVTDINLNSAMDLHLEHW